jgi:predicted transcriptional regulator
VNTGAPSNPDLQAKRRVDYEEWFLREVDQGFAAGYGGEFADHTAVRKMIDERHPG